MFNAPDSPHYETCTHRMDGVVGVKETEQVAVFWDPRANVYHYSIRVADWYSCNRVSSGTYIEYQDNPQLELLYIQGRVRELKSIQ